jgi:hypothetical protein
MLFRGPKPHRRRTGSALAPGNGTDGSNPLPSSGGSANVAPTDLLPTLSATSRAKAGERSLEATLPLTSQLSPGTHPSNFDEVGVPEPFPVIENRNDLGGNSD